MLFSEETDRKCFSEKWCDKSEVSLRETLMCSGLALHNRCPHRGIKKFASEKHASLSQYEMLLDNHVQGSGLAPPLQGSKWDLLLNSITARRLERMFQELGLKTLR